MQKFTKLNQYKALCVLTYFIKGIAKMLQYSLYQQEKHLQMLCKCLILLVENTGFEPITFPMHRDTLAFRLY